ncbi:hypothetical protein GRI97_07965 [Altererythrobacter xixiisoli]|uniref:Uncharacterized protein n=1 Tax=Croceibacterium xixiisoli TaxID=1476466 RepID=A0A6I4TUR0_9SPHN|nr:hypothetical protein [Croceibacterium xixiisoli]MXO98921.1 hypothetical protein [Croceibacterium xixiisoli]
MILGFRLLQKSHAKALRRITKAVGAGEALEVPITPIGMPEQCYWEVRKHVATNGGSLRTGWRLLDAMGKVVQAQHHAVWERPDGQLIDISPPPSSLDAGVPVSLFIPDDRLDIGDLAYPPSFDNISVVLSMSSHLAGYTQASQRQTTVLRAGYAKAREIGIDRHEAGMMMRHLIPCHPQMQAIAAEYYETRTAMDPFIKKLGARS